MSTTGLRYQIEELRAQLNGLMIYSNDKDVIIQIKEITAKIDELEAQEEAMWHQRNRQCWLTDGDKNTAFFHHKASQRRRINNIIRLQDENDQWVEGAEHVRGLIMRYFKDIYTSRGVQNLHKITNLIHPKVTEEMNQKLMKQYTDEEVHEAIMQMHPTKAPSPDGMPALFFQHYWHLIGKDVTHFVRQILNGNLYPGLINQTLITLIPKTKTPTTPMDFRAISLCNVIFKIVSKVVVNRLKEVLPNVIHKAQSAFVPGRMITDNIVVAFE